MTMLYKISQGTVKESQYGLTLARVVPLPPGLVENATSVAHKIEQHLLTKKRTSETVLKEKRRKLILNLKEHLMQAHTGVLEGEVLSAWLRELQKEFINRMTALEVEAASPEHVTEYEESNDGDVEMLYRSDNDGEDRPSTHASQASIVSISSRATSSTLSPSPQRSMSEASTIRAVSDNER
jgi:DNA mismatch repair protein MSH4